MAKAALTAYERAKGHTYAETFRCPGGSLCLNFCNTGQSKRGRQGVEWLPGFADLLGWLEAAGALTKGHAAELRAAAALSPEEATRVWQRAMRLREALYRVFEARVAGRRSAPQDLAEIEAEYALTASYARLAPAGQGYAWSVARTSASLDLALRPLVESAVALLTSESLVRLRRCGNSTCFWLFIDQTRNRSRRWCEMASCGNLFKARRHRERARRGTDKAPPQETA